MATYQYLCPVCLEQVEQTYDIGTAPRQTGCDCGGTMSMVIGTGLHIAAAIRGDAGKVVRDADSREDRWMEDMPAYRRLRQRGLQPKQIDGARMVEETCGDQLDIDTVDLRAAGVTRERYLEEKEKGEQLVKETLERG